MPLLFPVLSRSLEDLGRLTLHRRSQTPDHHWLRGRGTDWDFTFHTSRVLDRSHSSRPLVISFSSCSYKKASAWVARHYATEPLSPDVGVEPLPCSYSDNPPACLMNNFGHAWERGFACICLPVDDRQSQSSAFSTLVNLTFDSQVAGPPKYRPGTAAEFKFAALHSPLI